MLSQFISDFQQLVLICPGTNGTILAVRYWRVQLCEPRGPLLEMDGFRRLLHQILRAFAEFKVPPEYDKLDDFHLVRDNVMIIDLESVSEQPLTEEEITIYNDSMVDSLAYDYSLVI